MISAAGMKEVPLSPTRRTVAARLMHGRRTTVPVTITCRCDATQLVTLSRQLKAEGEAGRTVTVPTINDILIKLTGTALEQHPMLTGVWADGCILIPKTIHLGIAVDADDGLRVPVIRDVCSSTLAQIAAQTRKLIAAARAGQIAAADMQDGCFTISNLGSFGVDSFTPVINPPESAILGIGAIAREAVPLDDGSLATRERMTLSLTFDHRVIDGAPAARFLQTLRQLIEERFLGLV
jgi:pyruvate dehydrogenase E2 component (dihydrolipoamide acetyltransferase)